MRYVWEYGICRVMRYSAPRMQLVGLDLGWLLLLFVPLCIFHFIVSSLSPPVGLSLQVYIFVKFDHLVKFLLGFRFVAWCWCSMSVLRQSHAQHRKHQMGDDQRDQKSAIESSITIHCPQATQRHPKERLLANTILIP